MSQTDEWNKLSKAGDVFFSKIKETLKFRPKKMYAIIEDTKDPLDQNRVKIRIIGSDTPSKQKMSTEDLPWVRTKLPVGSSRGVGDTVNWKVDQTVEIEPTNASATQWIITSGSHIVPNEDKGDEAYGDTGEGDDARSKQEIVPGLSTGDLKKMAGTALTLLNSGLITAFTGTEPGDPSPKPPQGQNKVAAENLDWKNDPEKIVDRYGRILTGLHEAVTIDGKPARNKDIKLTLRKTEPKIIGYSNEDQSEQTAMYYNEKEGNFEPYSLYIPANVSPGNYELHFDVSTVKAPITTANFILYIQIVDINKNFRKRSTRAVTSNKTVSDKPEEVTIKEPEIKPTKKSADCKVNDQGGIVSMVDTSEGQMQFQMIHNHKYKAGEELDPDAFSRVYMGTQGETGMTSADDMILISKKNLNMYVANVVQQKIDERMTIHCPLTQYKGDVHITGNLHITGNAEITGKLLVHGEIESKTEVIAKTIKLTTHKHKQANDTGGDTQKETNSPTP